MSCPACTSSGRKILTIVFMLALLVSAGVWWKYFDTYHFAVVQDGVLYRDGVRSPRELDTTFRRTHFKTDVCLVTDEEFARPEFQYETQLCREKGVELVRIPIPQGIEPKRSEIEKFLQITQDKSKWPVLVHCAQGIQRTGMMVAAYQQRVLGYDKQRALDSVLLFGKGSERADAVKKFIEHSYTTSNQTASTERP